MKRCPNPNCGRCVVQSVTVCPACGAELPEVQEDIEGYDLRELVHERPGCVIWRAGANTTDAEVCLRVYSLAADGRGTGAARAVIERLAAVHDRYAVPTLAFEELAENRCMRVTPWCTVRTWGDLLGATGLFRDPARRSEAVTLLRDIARCFQALHKAGHVMPYVTLEDILVETDAAGELHPRLDAKLTRYLDLRDGAPSPETQRLNRLHPDLRNGRTLDRRSDVWSLGRIFLDLLSGSDEHADYQQLADDIAERSDPVALPTKLVALLRQMVEDDPDKRVSNMGEVADALGAIDEADIVQWNELAEDPFRTRRLRRRLTGVAAAAVLVAALITWIAFQHQRRRFTADVAEAGRHADAVMENVRALVEEGKVHVDQRSRAAVEEALAGIQSALPENRVKELLTRYSRSVALVLTEVWVEANGRREELCTCIGSAFLVSADGYLLTNRHVAAPWLSDKDLTKAMDRIAAALRLAGIEFRTGVTYRLWFDGDRAFRPFSTADRERRSPVSDRYYLDSAYSSGKQDRNVRLVGIMSPPVDSAEAVRSTLQNDAAVLKINSLPEGALPIPLRAGEPPPRGTRLVALGYPLGRAAVADVRAVLRSSEGAVTRVYRDMVASDVDIDHGNSGGPVLDLNGYVTGIVTAGPARAKGSSLVWLLPAATAAELLERAVSGETLRDGLPLTAFEPELKKALQAVGKGDWEGGRALADTPGVERNPDLALLAAVFCVDPDGFTDRGRRLLEDTARCASNMPLPHLLLYWDAWCRDLPTAERPGRQLLLEAPWHSPFEPYGQVIRILEGDLSVDEAVKLADSPDEFALILWAAGTEAARNGDKEAAVSFLRKTLDNQEFLDANIRVLAECALWRFTAERPEKQQTTPAEAAAQGNLAALIALARKEAAQMPDEPACRRPGLRGQTHVAVARDNWSDARRYTEQYLALPQRYSATGCEMALLHAQMLGLCGDNAAEAEALTAFAEETTNPWYRTIAECLLGKTEPEAAFASVDETSPETLTLAFAMALRAERDGAPDRAIEWYNRTLDTGRIDWPQLDIAGARRTALRSGQR